MAPEDSKKTSPDAAYTLICGKTGLCHLEDFAFI
jgi:hypothetical protein